MNNTWLFEAIEWWTEFWKKQKVRKCSLVSDVLHMQNHGHNRFNFFGQQGKEQRKEQLRWEKDELWNEQALKNKKEIVMGKVLINI